MTWVLKILWFLFRQQAELTVIDAAKIQALESYLKAVGGLRKIVIGGVGAIILAQLFTLSIVTIVGGSIFLIDLPASARIEIAMAVAVLIAVLCVTVFVNFARESRWYRLSGAEKMVEEFADEHAIQVNSHEDQLANLQNQSK